MADPALLGRGVAFLLQLAEQEAQQLAHPAIVPEHLLLAALRFGYRAALVPGRLGLTLEAARAALREPLGPRDTPPAPPAWSPAGERAVAAAVALAKGLGLPWATPDSLLLAAMDDPDSKVQELLSALGVRPAAMRQLLRVELLQAWWHAAEEPDAPTWERVGSALTAGARRAFVAAREAALRHPPHVIAPEQWLYALTEERGGVGDRALARVGGDGPGVRTRLSGLLRTTGDRWPGLPTGGERLSGTLRVVWAINAGTDEAVRRRHDLLGVEHLLFGFVRESLETDSSVLESVTGRPGWEGAGANVLELIGVDAMALTSTLEKELDQPPR